MSQAGPPALRARPGGAGHRRQRRVVEPDWRIPPQDVDDLCRQPPALRRRPPARCGNVVHDRPTSLPDAIPASGRPPRCELYLHGDRTRRSSRSSRPGEARPLLLACRCTARHRRAGAGTTSRSTRCGVPEHHHLATAPACSVADLLAGERASMLLEATACGTRPSRSCRARGPRRPRRGQGHRACRRSCVQMVGSGLRVTLLPTPAPSTTERCSRASGSCSAGSARRPPARTVAGLAGVLGPRHAPTTASAASLTAVGATPGSDTATRRPRATVSGA